MITLDSGNVLLTPSLRRQLMSRLRRAMRIGQRIGNFALNISLHRRGKHVTLTAKCHDKRGDFEVRAKGTTLADAFHEMARTISTRLHDQLLVRVPV